MKKVVFVVAPENFRDEELFEPLNVLKKNNEVSVASRGVKEAKGVKGGSVNIDIDINQLNIDEYDALVFIGGGGAKTYFEDEVAQDLAKRASERDKILGAICIAPTILANAGLLKGKKATSFPSQLNNLESKGAFLSEEKVVTDGKLVTATGPEVAQKFGLALEKLLNGE